MSIYILLNFCLIFIPYLFAFVSFKLYFLMSMYCIIFDLYCMWILNKIYRSWIHIKIHMYNWCKLKRRSGILQRLTCRIIHCLPKKWKNKILILQIKYGHGAHLAYLTCCCRLPKTLGLSLLTFVTLHTFVFQDMIDQIYK